MPIPQTEGVVVIQEPDHPGWTIPNWKTHMSTDYTDTKAQKASSNKNSKGSHHPTVRRLKTNETGMGVVLWAQIKTMHPNNPIQQVAYFMGQFQIPAATGRRRRASLDTHENYRERLNTVVNTLRDLNMPIRNLDEISPKQIRHVFHYLENEGRSVSWMANINTTVRRFGIWIGKPDLCPPLPELVSDSSAGRRGLAAKTSKVWDTTPEEFEDILRKVTQTCPMTALHLRLAMLFGCRVQEMLMFRPAKAIQGEFIHLEEGTKGGRARVVPIETDEQREWLDVALAMAEDDPKGRLIAEPGLTLRQAINHFYSVLRACGIDRKTQGVTAHGLRHSYACHIYKELTGEKAPILGGAQVEKEMDQKVRLDISRRLGHGRISVTNAYLGSHAALKKYARENLQRIEHQVKSDEALQTLIRAAGLDSLCLVGAMARGDTLGSNEPATVAYASKAQAGETQQQADIRAASQVMAICAQLTQTLGRRVGLECLSVIPGSEDRFELT